MNCEAATEEDYKTEYLDYILTGKLVDTIDEAISHINHYGSHHTDCIITEDDGAAGPRDARQAQITRVAQGIVPLRLAWCWGCMFTHIRHTNACRAARP